MKKSFIKILKVFAFAALIGGAGFATLASADVTSSFWAKQANGQLYTNSGNGLGNAIINVAGCNGCGGGGGPVTGLTGTPDQVVYIDNAGNGTGDALFTRDSVSKNTIIAALVAGDGPFIGLNPGGMTAGWLTGGSNVRDGFQAQSNGNAIMGDTTLSNNKTLFSVNDGTRVITQNVENTAGNITSSSVISDVGNSITWDSDTTDDLIATITQGDDILGTGIKGSSILYTDTVTEEKAIIFVGDGSGAGGQPFQISLRTDDGTGNISSFVGIDSINGISMGAEDLGGSFIASYVDFTLTGNTIQWDADTTDTITTKFEQNQSLFGFPVSGTGMSWSDSNTEVLGFNFVGDGTGIGSFPGTTTMGTLNNSNGSTATIQTSWDTTDNRPEVYINAKLGDLQSTIAVIEQYAKVSHRDTGTGQLAETVLGGTSVQSNYTTDGTTNYRTELSNGRFKFSNSTAGTNLLDINDITGGTTATYAISNNFLGFGLTGAGTVFNTGTGGYNLLASVDTTGFGGTPNTTFTGYTSFGPGPVANGQFTYNSTTDTAISAITAKSATAKTAQINTKATASAGSIEFTFDTGNYKFPTTSPASGQYVGYSSANQLGFSNPLTIGNALSSSTANRVLFANGSNNLAQSANFTFNTSTNTFSAGSTSIISASPSLGVVATQTSTADTFTATTALGKALKINTSGGMANLVEMGDVDLSLNKTRLSVVDSAKQITAMVDGEFHVYAATLPNAQAFSVNTNYLGAGDILVESGDIGDEINSTKLVLDDSAKTIKANLDGEFTIRDVANLRVASFDTTNGGVLLGDFDGAADATVSILPASKEINISVPDGKVSFTGGEYQNSTVEIDSAVSTTYTVLDGDRIIYVNTNTAAVTITLPSVATYDKRLVKIKCTGTNGVTIVASAGSVDTGSLATGEVGEWQALNSTITWQRVQ